MESILANLSTPDLLRLREVCKQWNHLPLEPSFAALHRRSCPLSPSDSGFIVAGTTPSSPLELYFVDASDCWRRIPLERMTLDPYLLQAASEGLLLFSTVCPGRGWILLLWNPCTGAFTRLPKVPQLDFPLLTGLCRNRATGEYKVVCAGDVGFEGSALNAVTMVYDSRIANWKESNKFPFNNYTSSVEPVCINGRIVFRGHVGGNSVVLVFDADKEKWVPLYSSLNTNSENQLGIACLGTEIRMVVGADLDIQVQKVQQGRRTQLGVLPYELWETEWSDAMYFWNQVRDDGEQFEFGDIEVTTHIVRNGNLIFIRVQNVTNLVVFDISKKSWHKLPSSPFEHVYSVFNFDRLL